MLQADGATRTPAIKGAYVAFALACRHLIQEFFINVRAFKLLFSWFSVGIVSQTPLLDLKYDEDSRAEVDMNIVCTGDGRFIEVQGTAEGAPFSRAEMDQLLALAAKGIEQLIAIQRAALDG